MMGDWSSRAACRDLDTDIFFTEDPEKVKTAQAVCAVCEVAVECLSFAIERGCEEGIFGGMTPRERERMVAEEAVTAS